MQRSRFLFLLSTVLLGLATVKPALAHDHDRGPHHWGGDIHRFHDRDFDTWRKGRWHHGRHGGRVGWWWIVGPTWYFYPSPIYPYPDPFTPSTVVVRTVQAVQPAPAQTAHYWYCSNPPGYYPYVPLCYAAWQRVDVMPSTTVVETAPQAAIEAPAAPAVTPSPAEPSARAVQAETQLQKDYRQLNDFSAELASIQENDSDAANKLRRLNNKVEAFRKSLLKRDYNAMNILRDTEDLKDRLAEHREAVRKSQMK